MQITIDTNTASQLELTALAALIAVLGGRPSVSESAPSGRLRVPGDDDDATLAPVDHSDEDADIVDAAVLAGAPVTDSAGLAWDARIHAASRATNADGTWRRRKNTPDDIYNAVMAELRGATDPTPEPSPEPTPDPVPAPPADTEPAADVAISAADVPAPPASDGPDLSSFAKFVSAVNGKDVPADKKTYQALNELCASTFGVAAFKDMKDKPGDWAMFYDMVG